MDDAAGTRLGPTSLPEAASLESSWVGPESPGKSLLRQTPLIRKIGPKFSDAEPVRRRKVGGER